MGKTHETHLSTIDYPAQAHAWISGSHENTRRPHGAAYASRQGPVAARRLTRTANKFSFSRAHRLDGPHAYAAVFAFKCWVTGEIFQVYAKSNGAVSARLGIVVSKRIVPQAVERSYCKRMAREVFRAERNALAGVDLVIRPHTAVPPALSAVARVELRDLLHRAQRLCRSRSEATRSR
jgi:ribonuclease P protein component